MVILHLSIEFNIKQILIAKIIFNTLLFELLNN